MAGALPGWNVTVDARVGRPLAEGMQIFDSTPGRSHTVYAFSLFTNDDPRRRPVRALGAGAAEAFTA